MSDSLALLGIKVQDREVKGASDSLDRLTESGRRAENQTKRLRGGHNSLERQVRRNTQQVQALTSAYQRLYRMAQLVAGSVLLKHLVSTGDEMRLVHARLKLVTKDMQELANVEKGLFAVAQQTRSGYKETANLYFRIARNSKELGLNQKGLLQVTKTINQAIISSGTTAQEASAGLIQFSQALASGVLRGDELRSVRENMPRLFQAIAAGMGTTTAKLNDMAKKGELTADKIIKALLKQRGVVEKEFKTMPMTVGASLTQLRNVWDKAISKLGESGFLDSLVKAFQKLAKWIERNGETFARLGAAAAIAVNAIVWGIEQVTDWVKESDVAVGLLAAAFVLLTGAKILAGLRSIIGLFRLLARNPLVTIITVVIGAILVLINKVKDLGALWKAVELMGTAAWQQLRAGFFHLAAGVAEVAEIIVKSFAKAVNFISKMFDKLFVGLLRMAMNNPLFRALEGQITEMLKKQGIDLKGFLEGKSSLLGRIDVSKIDFNSKELRQKADEAFKEVDKAAKAANDNLYKAFTADKPGVVTEFVGRIFKELNTALDAQMANTRAKLANNPITLTPKIVTKPAPAGTAPPNTNNPGQPGGLPNLGGGGDLSGTAGALRNVADAGDTANDSITQFYFRMDNANRSGKRLSGTLKGLAKTKKDFKVTVQSLTKDYRKLVQEWLAMAQAAGASARETFVLQTVAKAGLADVNNLTAAQARQREQIEKLAGRIHDLKNLNSVFTDMNRKWQEMTQSVDAKVATLYRWRQAVIESLDEANPRYDELLGKVNSLTAAQENLLRLESLRNRRDPAAGFERFARQYIDEASDYATQVENMATGFADNISNAFVNMAKTGKFEWKSLLDFMLGEIVKFMVKQLVKQFLQLILRSFSGIPGGGLWDGFAAPFGHGGGVVGTGGMASRMISAGAFSNAQRFHGGGVVGRERPIIAQDGEGVFTRTQMRHLAPVGDRGGLKVEIYDQRGKDSPPLQVTEESDDSRGRIMRILIPGLKKEMANGEFDDILASDFGVHRRAR